MRAFAGFLLLVAGLAACATASPAVSRAAIRCHGRRATIVSRASNKTVIGTPGRDVIAVRGLRPGWDERGPLRIEGRGGDDVICGGRTAETITGGGGDDWISGGDDLGAFDRIGGGAGDDVLRLGGVYHDGGIATGGHGNDTIRASGALQLLIGGPGRDRIYAGTSKAGSGKKDTASGGDGGDTIVSNGAAGQELEGDAGDDRLTVEPAGAAHGERIAGGGGADTISAAGGDDRIWGADAPAPLGDDGPPTPPSGRDEGDTIRAGGGKDTIRAGAGDDVVSSGGANDTITLGDGDDRVDAGGGDDTVESSPGNDTISGGGGDDVLYGGAGRDDVSGGSGTDALAGGSGDDALHAGGGVDHCSGEGGTDSCDGGTPTPSDPSEDPDICTADVEAKSDCREPSFVPRTWTGSLDAVRRETEETWTLTSDDARFVFSQRGGDQVLYALSTPTMHVSVTGASDAMECTWQGSGDVATIPAGSFLWLFLDRGYYQASVALDGKITVHYDCTEQPDFDVVVDPGVSFATSTDGTHFPYEVGDETLTGSFGDDVGYTSDWSLAGGSDPIDP